MKKFNFIALSSIVLGGLSFSPTTLAQNQSYRSHEVIPNSVEAENCTKEGDFLFDFEYDEKKGLACIVKDDYDKDLNHSFISMYNTRRNKLIYTGDTLGSQVYPYSTLYDGNALINNGEQYLYTEYPGVSVSVQNYITNKDIGKKIKYTITVNGGYIRDQVSVSSDYKPHIFTPLDEDMSPITFAPQLEDNEPIYNYKDGSDTWVESIVFEDKIAVPTQALQLYDIDEELKIDESVIDKISKNSLSFNKYTPTLNLKIEIGDEVRFDGVIKAYPIITEDGVDSSDYIPYFPNWANESFMEKDSLEIAKHQLQLFDDFYFPVSDRQSVNANVLNGGITGGIVSTEVGNDLAIEDVDFGKLSIGKEIKPVQKDKMVTVRDWTGGNGWKLTAQHKNSDRNESLQLSVQVNENTKVDLNNEAQPVTSGESQLEVITQGGTYTAEWGTHPTVGEFNNIIEWNLSANVNE